MPLWWPPEADRLHHRAHRGQGDPGAPRPADDRAADRAGPQHGPPGPGSLARRRAHAAAGAPLKGGRAGLRLCLVFDLLAPRAQGGVRPTENGSLRKAR
jgi:hypothetical protein